MVGFSFFAREASLSVAEIAALTGAEPCAGADLSRRLTGIAPDQVPKTALQAVTPAAKASFCAVRQSV